VSEQKWYQSFKFGRRFVGVVSLSDQHVIKFADCLIVVHIFPLMKGLGAK
jgi:hypothetical protein